MSQSVQTTIHSPYFHFALVVVAKRYELHLHLSIVNGSEEYPKGLCAIVLSSFLKYMYGPTGPKSYCNFKISLRF